MIGRRLSTVLVFLWLLALARPGLAELPEIRVGVLGFGTVNWEMDAIQHHGLDRENGIFLRVLPYATNRAVQVALQAGEADVIVADWIFAARLRAQGIDTTFFPYSTSIGSLMVAANSAIGSIGDLKGKRIGIAGGPLDKSWLLLRAATQAKLGFDLADELEAVYGAPPLLNEELRAGRLDGLLTYWHYAVRLEAGGMRRLVSVADIARELSGGTAMPSLGFLFSSAWAIAHPEIIEGFIASSRAAKKILATSDAEWERLAPRLNAEDLVTRRALKQGFRAGIPVRWGPKEREGAKAAFDIMRRYGGDAFTGGLPFLDPETFWPHADF